jgi:hypothetical protein
MAQSISLVQRLQIASPCAASWNDMKGDHRSRFCAQCELNVYNFAAMTQEEGERLIIEKEGKLCARIYRRTDGTVITHDCPVGLAALRKQVARSVKRTFAAMLGIAATVGGAIAAGNPRSSPLDPELADLASKLGINILPTPFTAVLARVGAWLDDRTPMQAFMGSVIITTPVMQELITESSTRATEEALAGHIRLPQHDGSGSKADQSMSKQQR